PFVAKCDARQSSDRTSLEFLYGLQVDGLRAARIRLDVERHALSFLQAAQSRLLDRSRMDEHVLAAAFRSNESEALVDVEKLDGSDRHERFLGTPPVPLAQNARTVREGR